MYAIRSYYVHFLNVATILIGFCTNFRAFMLSLTSISADEIAEIEVPSSERTQIPIAAFFNIPASLARNNFV